MVFLENDMEYGQVALMGRWSYYRMIRHNHYFYNTHFLNVLPFFPELIVFQSRDIHCSILVWTYSSILVWKYGLTLV